MINKSKNDDLNVPDSKAIALTYPCLLNANMYYILLKHRHLYVYI